MTLGFVPAASTTAGSAISSGMAAQSMFRVMESGTAFATLDFDSPDRFQRLRAELGITSFGLNLIVLRAGQRGRIHRHRRQEEVYVVLEGTLTLFVEGEEHTLQGGAVARVGPDVRRQLVNRGPGSLVLLAMGGAEPHEGRDGEAATGGRGWLGRGGRGGAGRQGGRGGGAFEGGEGRETPPPQEMPLPPDLSEAERAG